MLSLFAPTRPRRRAFVRSVAETLLNGDWRRLDCIEHVCVHDCCPSFEVSVQRVADALASVFVAVRPSIFNKGNWRTWSRNLSMFGLGGAIHGVLAAAYAIAFENASVEDVMTDSLLQRPEHLALDLGAMPLTVPSPENQVLLPNTGKDAGVALEEDKVEFLRREKQASQKIAGACLRSDFFTDVLLLR
eukprot:5133082-Amphidinium_carterae.1